MARSTKGAITVAGGFLIHLILGTVYMWGNLNVYVRSYFCYNGDYGVPADGDCSTCTLSQSDVGVVFPFLFQGLTLMVPFGVIIGTKLGFQITAIIGSVVLSGGILASSFTTNFWAYAFLYGILFGLVGGTVYMIPMFLGHRYFPNNKGVVSGIISSGFGLGSLVFSEFAYEYINPDNDNPKNGCYTREVADNLPGALRYLSLMYVCTMVIGSFLLQTPSNMDIEEIDELEEQIKKEQEENLVEKAGINECPTIKIALKQPALYILVLQNVTLAALGIMVSSNYKPYGQLFDDLNDDGYLTWVGNAGSIMNSLSRFFWGFMMDCISFRYVAIGFAFFQLIIASTITFITGSKALYMIYIILAYFAYGGLYAVFPTLSSKLFGKKVGLVVIGVIFQGFSLACWIQYFVVKFGVGDYPGLDEQVVKEKKQHDFAEIFHIYIVAPLIAIVLAIFMNYRFDWNVILQKYGYGYKDDAEDNRQQDTFLDEDDGRPSFEQRK